MKKEYNVIWIALAIAIFLLGYFLRAYLTLNKDLPYSPYEAFTSSHTQTLFGTGPAKDYTDKSMRYPASYLLGKLVDPVFGKLYIIYILGAVIIFFLGKETANNALGGFLAFSLYAVAPENLLQYTRAISPSGLCYIFIWAGILFFLRYLKNKGNINLALFVVFFLLALTSYHTGATAAIMLLTGLLVSLGLSPGSLEKKGLFSFFFLMAFYIIWISLFDISQIISIKSFIFSMDAVKITCGILALSLFMAGIFWAKRAKFRLSGYLPLLAIAGAAILVFSDYHFFKGLLRLGVKNYYSSAVTLNNYFAQGLLTHIYVLPAFILFSKKKLGSEGLLIRGWIIGLVLISSGLAAAGYFSRVFDYTFPLMFILFGLYWSKNKRFRIFIVPATIILLSVSQLVIYSDPFTMRRYYNNEEIRSAKNIIALDLNGKIASDLRTAALFSYLGKKGIRFGKSGRKLHDRVFYNPRLLSRLKRPKPNYVILSESMRHIVYARDFETTPLGNRAFKYYRDNFREAYNDGLMRVYKISE